MSDDDLLCPFCQKKVGLAGMYVAHIINCGKNQIANLQAAVDDARVIMPIYSNEIVGNPAYRWLKKYGDKPRSQYEPTDEGEPD